MYDCIELEDGRWQVINTRSNRKCGEPHDTESEAIQVVREANNASTGMGAGE